MDEAALAYLLSLPGQALLDAAATAYADGDALRAADRLRRHHAPDHVAAALTQVRLRSRAADKLGADARRMYFTSDGLQQATARQVADHRAVRIAASGQRRLLDLGCGIGSDLLAAARAGLDVTGMEQDPVTAVVARANLAALGLPGNVAVGDVAQADRSGYDVVFADPARRDARGRTFDPGAFSPPWSFVETLLTETAVVKTAPGIPHTLVPDRVEAEWVSLDGRLREAVLWSGLGGGVARRASVLNTSGVTATVTDRDDPGAPEVREVGAFVYEPDDAVIRAHLVSAVVVAVNGGLVDPHLAYVTADVHRRTPLARAYAVEEVLPFRERQLRAALRARGVGQLTVKKRGVAVTPEALRRRLDLRGGAAATIIVTRTPASAVVLLVTPLA